MTISSYCYAVWPDLGCCSGYLPAEEVVSGGAGKRCSTLCPARRCETPATQELRGIEAKEKILAAYIDSRACGHDPECDCALVKGLRHLDVVWIDRPD